MRVRSDIFFIKHKFCCVHSTPSFPPFIKFGSLKLEFSDVGGNFYPKMAVAVVEWG